MATYTQNLNLEKPDMTDAVSPRPFNSNFDKIDKAFGEMDQLVQQANKSTFNWDASTSTLTINL